MSSRRTYDDHREPLFHPINRRKGVTFPSSISRRYFEEWRNPVKRWLARSWFRKIGEPRAKERGGIIRADPNDRTSGIFLSSRSDGGGGGDSFWPGKNGSATSAEFLAESSIPYAAQTISLSLSSPHFIVCPGDDVSNLLEIEIWSLKLCKRYPKNSLLISNSRKLFVKVSISEKFYPSIVHQGCHLVSLVVRSYLAIEVKIPISNFWKRKKKERKGRRWFERIERGGFFEAILLQFKRPINASNLGRRDSLG